MKLFKRKGNYITEEEAQSIPMRLILKLKAEIRILLLINLIMAIAFAFSVYDSIAIRDRVWDEHLDTVIEIIEEHHGDLQCQD
jgi:hypothetical protein